MSNGCHGHNPMRWDCQKRGCFNLKRRPKIEIFSDCFPGKISFGDVDGIVEVNGWALMLEWKTDATKPTTGQRIMYERLTANSPITVMVLVGDAEAMRVTHFGYFRRGEYTPLRETTTDETHSRISRWCEWARRQPSPPQHYKRAEAAV